MIFVGVDIGGTKTAIGIFSDKGEIIAKDKFPTPDTSPQNFCDAVISKIKSIASPYKISGIGIGVPGFVDFKSGTVSNAPNAPMLNGFPLRDYFADVFNVPVFIDNDANLAALAEHTLGAGRGFENMIYSTVSTGIGGGLIISGQLFRGSYGTAGEIGHTIVSESAHFPCACGNSGCVESMAGGKNIPEFAKEIILSGVSSSLLEMCSGDFAKINGEILLEALKANDKAAELIFERICHYHALLYYNLYMILNINCYVLGGGLTNFGDMLFNGIQKEFDLLLKDHPPVYFKKSELGQDFGIIGAMLLAKSEIKKSA